MDRFFEDALAFCTTSVEKQYDDVKFLHTATMGDGCVCMVYESEGHRWYHAVALPGRADSLPEITRTREYKIIPQRFADPYLWGDYYDEVFTDALRFQNRG